MPPMTRRTLPSLAAAALALLVLAGAPRAQASVGDLDPTFDGDGRVVFRHVNPIDGAYAVVVQPDGKAAVGGGFDSTAFATASPSPGSSSTKASMPPSARAAWSRRASPCRRVRWVRSTFSCSPTAGSSSG